MRPSLLLGVVVSFLCLPLPLARAEVTAAQVNAAIARGAAYLEAQQTPQGNWKELAAEPIGVSALCTLALLRAGRTTADPSVKNALAYFERSPDPMRTYSASLLIMVYARADPQAHATRIKSLTNWLVTQQVTDHETKGGWSYGRNSRADNSNTRFAILALHEAARAGVPVPEQTWRLARDYWLKPGMQHSNGGYGYVLRQPPTGSMTCAAIASLRITQDHLAERAAGGNATAQQVANERAVDDTIAKAFSWMDRHFSVKANPTGQTSQLASSPWTFYYLHTLQRASELSGRRYFDSSKPDNTGPLERRDWYCESCTHLLELQDKTDHFWTNESNTIERDPLIATSFSLLFLARGSRLR